MLRLLELSLFLVPFAGYLTWRALASGGGPSPALIAGAATLVLLIAAALIWFGTRETLGPSETYVPARVDHGRIVPGHAAETR